MKQAAIWTMLTWGLIGVTAHSQAVPSIEEITPSEVTTFRFKGHTYSVFESTRNLATAPNTWLFRYQPLMLPVMSPDGKSVAVKMTPYVGNRYLVVFHLIMEDQEARVAALQALHNVRREHRGDITLDNVDVIAPRTVTIRMNELSFFPDATLLDAQGAPQPKSQLLKVTQSYTHAQPIEIKILTGSKATADDLVRTLNDFTLGFNYTFDTRDSTQATWSLSMNTFKDTELNNTLKDGGTGKLTPTPDGFVYVSRHDFRTLVEKSLREADFKIVTEFPNAPELPESVFLALLNEFREHMATEEINSSDEARKATFNWKDLEPDHFKRVFKEALQKSSTRDEYHLNVTASVRANGNLLGILSGGAAGSGTYTSSQLKERMNENYIQEAFEGDRIVPKRVDLIRLNLTRLLTSAKLSGTFKTLGKLQRLSHQGTVSLNEGITHPLSDRLEQVLAQGERILSKQTPNQGPGHLTTTLIATPEAKWQDFGEPYTINTPFSGYLQVSGNVSFLSNLTVTSHMRLLIDDHPGSLNCSFNVITGPALGPSPSLATVQSGAPVLQNCTIGMTSKDSPLLAGQHVLRLQFNVPQGGSTDMRGLYINSSGLGHGFNNMTIVLRNRM